MSDLTERLKLLIEADASGAIKQLKNVGDGSEAQIGGKAVNALKSFTGNSSLVTGALGKIENAFSSIPAPVALAGAGIVAAGGVLAKFALDGVEKFSAVTLEVTNFQRATGASAEDSSKFTFALKEMGVPVENVEKGLFKLEQTIGRGKDKLDEYGISVARNKNGTFDLSKTVENIAEAFQHTQDPAKRAALLFDLFGKSGQNMVPILEKSKKDLDQLFSEAGKDHQIFSQSDLEAGIKYREAMDGVHASVQGLEIELGEGLIPVLTDAANTLTGLIHGVDDITGHVGGLGNAFNLVGDVIGNPIREVGVLGDVLQGHFSDGLHDAIHNLPVVGAAMDLFGGSSDGASHKVDAVSTASSRLADVMNTAGASSEDAGAAALTLDAAQSTLAQGTANLTDRQKQEVQAAQQQLQAFQRLQGAVSNAINDDLSYQSSQLGVQSAAQALASELQTDAQNHDTSAAATLRQQQASLALREAIVGEAQAASKKAQDDLGPNADGYAVSLAGSSAYAAELQKMANSNIPAVRQQAQLLLMTAQDYGHQWPGTFTADTSQATGAIAALEAQWNNFVGGAKVLAGPTGNVDLALKFLSGHKAAGGPVGANRAYLVGEQGPEVFVPGTSGSIVPNDRLAGGGRAFGATNVYVTVNVPATVDKAAVGKEIAATLKAYERTSGTSWRA